MQCQVFADRIFPFCKGQHLPILFHLFRSQIKTEPGHFHSILFFSLLSSQVRVHPGADFLCPERFFQIVIPAQAQPQKNIRLPAFGSQKNNGAVCQIPDFPAQRKAVYAGHHNVQKY